MNDTYVLIHLPSLPSMYNILRGAQLSPSSRVMSSALKNSRRSASWKAVAPSPLPGPTFAAQPSLPRLPVPELSDTLTKLKDSLKPVAWNDSEFQAALRKIDEFGAPGGPGTELQKRLQKRREETSHWLEEWWDDIAYLTYRDSVVVNVSYYYGFDEHPRHLSQGLIPRAAALTRAAMQFRQLFKQGQVKPESTREGPLCMDTWRWMFDCCRVPGLEGKDWSVTYAKEGDTGNSGHVIVLRKGRVWRLDPWQNGSLLSVTDLEKQIQHIVENTPTEFPGVGVLTASNRDIWAKDYNTLISDPTNASIIEDIHSAAFVLCLDTEQPADLVSHSRALWHGAVSQPTTTKPILGLRNRWVDKPVQFVVFENGKAGIMGEHSVMDGTPTVTLCDTVLNMIASPEWDQGQAQNSSASLPVPRDWKVSPQIETAIENANQAALALIGSQNMNIVRTPYGKQAIKAFSVSPDSWAQLLVQLAYARLLRALNPSQPFHVSRQGATYEAATTRKFFKGRTEAIRVVSSESDEWVRSMDDPNVSDGERKTLFEKAAKKHIVWAKMAGNGLGVDRHMLGLKKTLKEGEPLPAIYSDPLFQRSSNWVLSTSAIFSKHFETYGWGEVVPDGFGVAYMTGFDDYLQYTITSRTEMPNKKFCRELERAAQDLYTLHVNTRTSSTKSLL